MISSEASLSDDKRGTHSSRHFVSLVEQRILNTTAFIATGRGRRAASSIIPATSVTIAQAPVSVPMKSALRSVRAAWVTSTGRRTRGWGAPWRSKCRATKFSARVEREARTVATLDHPHVCQALRRRAELPRDGVCGRHADPATGRRGAARGPGRAGCGRTGGDARGVRPFGGATTAVVFERILNQSVPTLPGSGAHVPAGLSPIVARLLEKDRGRDRR